MVLGVVSATFTVPSPRMSIKMLSRKLLNTKYCCYITSHHITVKSVLRQNVLIDESFTAKVADFGFVTPLPTNDGSKAIVTARGAIGLARTRGYTAPEYADGKRGPKTDVYMYGVVSVICNNNTNFYWCRCPWFFFLVIYYERHDYRSPIGAILLHKNAATTV